MKKDLQVRFSKVDLGFGGAMQRSEVFHKFDATLTLNHSSVTILRGKNGVGKTLLAKMIAGSVIPSAGQVTIYDGGSKPVTKPNIIYIPQNFEGLHDRYATDFFLSIAGAGKQFFNPFSAYRFISSQLGSRSSIDVPCDTLPRSLVIHGSLLAADYANVDLVILDEPFAQFAGPEQVRLDEYILQRHKDERPPLLIIAHPGQSSLKASQYLRLESVDGTSKRIIITADESAIVKAAASRVVGADQAAFKVLVKNEVNVNEEWDVCRLRVNTFSIPDKISPGRLASIIVRALTHQGPQNSAGWTVEVKPTQGGKIEPFYNIRLLPANAQIAVVSSKTPISYSALFDRWEDAPTLGFPRQIDLHRLETEWFREAAVILPLQHESPNLLGSQLSGGNRQLLALRTTLYPLPDAFVAVTPFAGLDEDNTARVESVLQFAADSGTLVILLGGGN